MYPLQPRIGKKNWLDRVATLKYICILLAFKLSCLFLPKHRCMIVSFKICSMINKLKVAEFVDIKLIPTPNVFTIDHHNSQV